MKATALARPNRQFLNALKVRREKFLAKLGGGIAIVPNAAPSHSSREFYRPDSHFYYLTGCSEAECVAVFAPQHPTEKTILFLAPRDPGTELWSGPMVGVERAVEYFGFDAAYPLSQLSEKLADVFRYADEIYWNNNDKKVCFDVVSKTIGSSRLRRNGATLHTDVDLLIGDLRLFKDEWEISQLQIANDISSRAHETAMRTSRVGMMEYEVQAALQFEMCRNGALHLGYPSIVASGSNSCCLHYNTNGCAIEEGDLLLIDAGGEFQSYTADITRTFPVGGNFSGEQRAIYELVLETQEHVISLVRPGARLSELNAAMREYIADGLVQLGLLKGSKEEIRERDLTKDYVPHSVSHWLGLDVHDAGRYRIKNEERILEPGMCLTIEPGVYVQLHNENAAPQWRGIGVRIEDDVLVTETGMRNFTSCVKKIADVEALARGNVRA